MIEGRRKEGELKKGLGDQGRKRDSNGRQVFFNVSSLWI